MSFVDLDASLKDWPYHPDRISVRKIRTEQGEIKIQQRVELGIMQMEVDGRPDGGRPHDCDTLLDYQQRRMAEYERRNGTVIGFSITPEECRDLREEASLYYRRYVASFVLEEFDRVVRDTGHNLAILDFLRDHADEGEERNRLEAFRPYILMMQARGNAHQAIREGHAESALAHVNRALMSIRAYYDGTDHPELYDECEEVKILEQMRSRIGGQVSVNPVSMMREALKAAIAEERFEEAARLRDELDKLGKQRVSEG
ncbi:MAG: hypothetical protein C4547_13210 [Phycisphaerales bacterium]|nr:MAG: hypothetical protein C4547_13210 [Phycisphaerales bacterium]